MFDDFPRTLSEFERRFDTEDACWQYLVEIRWPRGFRCPGCGGERSCQLTAGRRFECSACGRQTSVTAGTIFHGTRKPLKLWFQAIFYMTTQKGGVSARTLEKVLGLSYETAWTWLQKLRAVITFRPRNKLRGAVEADETMVGGVEEGKPGRSFGNKSLVYGAVEDRGRASGRVRLELVEDATSKALCAATSGAVEKGAQIKTDGLQSYKRLTKHGFKHLGVVCSGKLASEALPHVHRVFSLLKRVFLGTYQGSIGEKHLPGYLQEFEFRFNRRRAKFRTKITAWLLRLAVATPPFSQDRIIAGERLTRAA